MLGRVNETFVSGLLFATVGFVTSYFSLDYQLGTAARMGPGYFPFWVGAILGCTGLGIALGSLFAPEERPGRLSWRVLGLITGSVVAFGLALKFLGLVLTVVAVTGLALLASPEAKLRLWLALSIPLAVFCALIFAYGLGLPLPIWPGVF